uniref:Uncharacterized protein n=1 Tax=Arundo donax TaxID=35708 RepID=A0A0A9GP15_ARUDO
MAPVAVATACTAAPAAEAA